MASAQYGVVTIDHQDYIERAQIFPVTLDITIPLNVVPQQRVTLPGVANFLLKGLTREVVVNGISASRRFKFRYGNSDGMTWYVAGGIGATSERVIDSSIFGTGQFPYAIIPPITFSAGANIMFEIEDVSGLVPYTINFAFHGSYLIPVATG